LCVASMSNPDLEHIFVSELVKRDYRVEWYPPPWEKASRGREKPPIDLVEIGFAARIRCNAFPPIIAHRGGFPPRPVGNLPFSVLFAVVGRLDRAVKSNGFILEFHSQSSVNQLPLRALSLRGILGLFAGLGIQPVLQGGRMRHGDDVVP
jgi:hypothetical protein